MKGELSGLCPGDLSCPFLVSVGGGARFASVRSSGHSDTTCGIITVSTGAGHVLCWGANDSGQTGRSASTFELVDPAAPIDRSGSSGPLVNARRLAVGRDAACAIDDQERLWCWGEADYDAATPPSHLATIFDVFGAP